MSNAKEIHSALIAAAHAYQCVALIEKMASRDPRTTGFHALAARRMADRAWAGFTSLVTDEMDYQEAIDRVEGVADCAESAGRILTAYCASRQ